MIGTKFSTNTRPPPAAALGTFHIQGYVGVPDEGFQVELGYTDNGYRAINTNTSTYRLPDGVQSRKEIVDWLRQAYKSGAISGVFPLKQPQGFSLSSLLPGGQESKQLWQLYELSHRTLQRYNTESGTSLSQVRDALKRLQASLRPYEQGFEGKPENVQEAVRALREAQSQMNRAIASAAQPTSVTTRVDGRGLHFAGRERSLDGSLLGLKIWYQRRFNEELKVHGTSSSEGRKNGIVVVEDAGIPFVKGDGTHRERLTMDPAALQKLSQLGFRVLPRDSGSELRLSFQGDFWLRPGPTSSPARAGGGTPSAQRPELAPQSVIERLKKGQDLGVHDPEDAKRVLDGLLKSEQYDWYRFIARALYEKGMLQKDFSAGGMPFQTLVPRHSFISVVSIANKKNFEYSSGKKADSVEVRITANGHPITLIAPRDLNFDSFLNNVGIGIQPYLSSPLLRELKTVVIDPGKHPFQWRNKQGQLVKDASAAYVHSEGPYSGLMVFPESGENFNAAVWHHEFGHLLADKLRKAESNPIAKLFWSEGGPHPGKRFEKLYRNQGSYSDYGSSTVVEGFAEAWEDYMTNRGARLSPEQVKLLQSLGISNTFSSGPGSWMWPIYPLRRIEPSRRAAKVSVR